MTKFFSLKNHHAIFQFIQSPVSIPVLTGTSSASAMNAFNNFSFFEFCFGDSADAHRAEVRVSGLDAAEATQILITLKNQQFFNLSFSKITLTLLNKYFNFDLQHSQVSETANF